MRFEQVALLVIAGALGIAAGGNAASEARGAAGSDEQAVIRVPGDYATIQEAIAAAVPGDAILVAPGEYEGPIDFGGKDLAVLSSEGPEVTTILGPGSTAEFDSVVVFRNGESDRAMIDGFTISGGTGTFDDDDEVTRGGAILCIGSSPVIAGNRIVFNIATEGAGIYCEGTRDGVSPAIFDNRIESNTTFGGPATRASGAGIFCRSSSPSITGNEFVRNAITRGTGDGSAIGCENASPEIRDNELVENMPGETTAAAIYAEQGSVPRIESNSFVRNRIFGIRLREVDFVVLRDNRFDDDAIELFVCNGVQIEDSRFEDSIVVGSRCADLTIERCRFEDRAWFLGSCSAPRFRSVSVVGARDSASFRIVNSDPGAEFVHVSFIDSQLDLQFGDHRAANSIFWNHGTLPIFARPTVSLMARHCNILGGWPGEGNFDAEPLAVDVRGGDPRLLPSSPCVDAGTLDVDDPPLFDLEGQPRSLPGRPGAVEIPDVGADEMDLPHAVRFGGVAAGRPGTPAADPVLFAQGSFGNEDRVVEVPAYRPVAVAAVPALAGPNPARFCVYAWLGEPTLDTVREQPRGLGFTAFATPLDGSGSAIPLAISNNLGFASRLGETRGPIPFFQLDAPSDAGLPSSPIPPTSLPAPSNVFLIPGLPPGRTVTVQGFIRDGLSLAEVPGSVTNAVVIRSR